MTANLKSRTVTTGIMVLVIFAIAIFSMTTQAQDTRLAKNDKNQPHKVNAVKHIHLGTDINTEAKAIPLQNSINSGQDDIKPRLSPDGKRLYFSRTFHPGNTYGEMDSEDIWYSEYNEGTWSEPIHMVGDLNNAGPNYVNNVSPTGDTLILGNEYLKKGKMRAGLSYSINVNGQWSTPINIPIKNFYNMSEHGNAFVSLKNGVIIQSIERGESIGERDLFVSFWDGESATESINMGAVINTEMDESSPFLAEDGKTLYFASKGHDGYGNFDIYVSRRLDDTWMNWSAPENLGPAVNGPMDDEFFSVSKCGRFGVFSREVSIHNTDIFRISFDELYNRTVKNKKLTDEGSLAGL